MAQISRIREFCRRQRWLRAQGKFPSHAWPSFDHTDIHIQIGNRCLAGLPEVVSDRNCRTADGDQGVLSAPETALGPRGRPSFPATPGHPLTTQTFTSRSEIAVWLDCRGCVGSKMEESRMAQVPRITGFCRRQRLLWRQGKAKFPSHAWPPFDHSDIHIQIGNRCLAGLPGVVSDRNCRIVESNLCIFSAASASSAFPPLVCGETQIRRSKRRGRGVRRDGPNSALGMGEEQTWPGLCRIEMGESRMARISRIREVLSARNQEDRRFRISDPRGKEMCRRELLLFPKP
jgi:hypothetical protein